jgi:membrane-associated phospholipid phosphatase
MKKTILLLIFLSQFTIAWTQKDTLIEDKIYHLNRKIEIPVTIGLISANYLGFQIIKNKTPLTPFQISSLNKNDVLAFDRSAVTQNYNSAAHQNAKDASDLGLNISVFLPAILYFDKNIRSDAFNYFLLYLETQAVNTSLYTYAGSMFTNRKRPFVYYPEVDLERKTGSGTMDSFFSGHTSSTTTAAFFMAQVFLDYHPEFKHKWAVYTAAMVPSVFVGYSRYKALMHFPSDVIVGIAVGAASGILVPALHKVKFGKKQNLTITPFGGNYTGLALVLKI